MVGSDKPWPPISTLMYTQNLSFSGFLHAEFEVKSLKMKSENNVRLGGFGCKGLGNWEVLFEDDNKYKRNITLCIFCRYPL